MACIRGEIDIGENVFQFRISIRVSIFGTSKRHVHKPIEFFGQSIARAFTGIARTEKFAREIRLQW
jgi:N6-adenosine-specific RNA methylase IME4